MSYPGPLSPNVNLGCDTGNQRATDQFNFVVDNGSVAPGPTVPTSLQSPASVLSAVDRSSSLAIGTVAQSGATSLVSMGNFLVGSGSVLNMRNGNFNASEILMGSNGTQVALAVNNYDSTLNIGNAAVPADVVAKFNTAANITDIGNPLNVGAIYLNNTTTVTSSGSRPPVGGIVLEQLNADSSSITQQVASAGILQIGSSQAFTNTLLISDVTYLGADNFVEINGAPGNAPLFLSGAQGPAEQCGIHPDITSGGQLLLGSSNAHTSQIQITDATVQYNVVPTINTSFLSTSARIPASGTMVTNTDYNVANPTNVGLYAIVVNVDNTAAGTNNAQASSTGYWNGTIWDWGGTARSCPFGNGELIIGFGLNSPNAVRSGLTVTFTGNTQNPAVYVKFIPLYGNLGI